MKKFIIFFLNLILCIYGFAQYPPTLQCIQPLLNGRLFVSWTWDDTTQVDPNDEEYLFIVNGVTVATQQANLRNGSTELFINDYSLISNGCSCYIQVRKNSTGQTRLSNTISTIQLTITPINYIYQNTSVGDSTGAQLTWNPISSFPTQSSWDGNYNIYKRRWFETDFANTPTASVPISDTSYIDPSDVCHNYIYYQVSITNRYGSGDSNCVFKSNIRSIRLNDSIPPQTPVLDSVSVTEDNHIVLGFHALDPFMMYYPVYYLDGGVHLKLQDVYNTTYWTDNHGDPNNESREYFIAVMDSCNNSSPQTCELCGQCNIHLAPPSTDACHRTAHLTWNAYKNMNGGGVKEYLVFLRQDGETDYTLIGTTTQTNFNLSNLSINTNYRVYVQARSNDHTVTSSSNRVNFTIATEESDDETYIRHVSVMDNRYISILVHTTGDLYPFRNIILQRSEDGQSFETIASLPYHSNPEYEFMDSTAKFTKQIYYYRTHLLGDCDVPVGYSNISHNILLTGTSSSAHDCNLEWNDYGTWDGGVDHYIVSRRNEYDTSFLELPDILAPYTHNTYSDDVSMMFQSGSKFTYFVTAYEGSNSNGIGDESISNHVTLQQESSMIIANAFTPNYDGHNDVFLPSNVFVSEEGYELIIVSRYGKTMFKTTDPTAGWDGYDMRRNPAPMGVYTYIIHYVNVHGKVQQVQGSVTLIR